MESHLTPWVRGAFFSVLLNPMVCAGLARLLKGDDRERR